MALNEHLEKLRHFHQLTNYSSIREASQNIGLSQAGLSKSLAALEEVLGVQLFLRSREGLTLTKEGVEVLKTTRKIMTDASDLENNLRKLKRLRSPKKVRIGMYDSIAVYFGTELSEYMKSIYPDVILELTADSSSSLLKKLQDNKLDVAIGVNFDKHKSKSLSFFKLFDDHYSFYVSSKHATNVNAEDLILHKFATDQDGVTVEEHLKDIVKNRAVHQVMNFETLKTLTTNGFGIGVLPTQVAKPLVKTGALESIEISKKRHLFGLHSIGFLTSERLLASFPEFADDIYRLGQRWSKS